MSQDSEDTWMNKWLLIEFVALFGLNVADITLKTCCPSVAFAVGLFKLLLLWTAGFELL